MPSIIDFHCHILPDRVQNAVSRAIPSARIHDLRRMGRFWFRPFSSSLHRSQVFMRHLPLQARRWFDSLAGLAPLPVLLFESSAQDLLESMTENGIDRAVVIAHPPHIPNELVLEAAQASEGRLIPAVNIPTGTQRPGQTLKSFHSRGAKILKIHPAADGEGIESSRYRTLLKSAEELGMPVIIHTGCIHSSLLFKNPELGRAEIFSPWFEKHPTVKFILAHMNYHEPHIAIDLAEEFENLYVDTSWQPSEAIGEAVRRIGSNRILLGTDWPFVGNNLSIGLSRIRESVSAGLLSEKDSENILGLNAEKLLNATSV